MEMASDDALHQRLDTRTTHRRAEPSPYQPSKDLPARFKHIDDDGEDVAKTGGRDAGAYMHQSVFNMIPAFAGRGHSNFQSRFDDDPSESEEDREEHPGSPAGIADTLGEDTVGKKKSPSTLFKSMAQLQRPRSTTVGEDRVLDHMSSSQILPPRKTWHHALQDIMTSDDKGEEASSQAPVLSRMLTAEAEMEASQANEASETTAEDAVENAKPQTSLAERLQQIFKFKEPEDVITEHACWFLQTVMLHGYMYITQHHVCFYAYLPKKESEVTKSGYLSKRQRTRPKSMYRRFFFELRGDYMTYYTDSSKKYFPYGHIDLRNAISAIVEPAKEAGKESTSFTVATANRNYSFRADSAESAKSWEKQLQRVILRLNNDGDSVKICLPIKNIVGVESNSSLDFADTIKIQVFDNQESFAIDDFLFSFFIKGDEVYRVLKIMTEENDHHTESRGTTSQNPPVGESGDPMRSLDSREESGRAPLNQSGRPRTAVDEEVPATVPALRSPSVRRTIELTQQNSPAADRRRNANREGNLGGRSSSAASQLSARSPSHHGEQFDRPSPVSSKPQDSPGSISRSLAQDTESSAAIQSLNDTDASASQMLEQSTLFHTPTVQRVDHVEQEASIQSSRRGSEVTARSLEMHDGARATRRTKDHGDGATFPPQVGPSRPGAASAERPLNVKRPSESNQPYMLRDLVRAGANPIQTASDVTQYLTKRSKDMSNLLASESMGYYEKVSGMWAGKRKHYHAPEGLMDDEVPTADDEQHAGKASKRYQDYFALPDSEQLKAIYFASIQRVLPLYGKIYIGHKHFCFRSLLPGTRFKVVLPFDRIENVIKERGYRPGHPGVVVVIRGFEELFFEFSRKDDRDDCVVTLLRSLEQIRYMQDSVAPREAAPEVFEPSKLEHQLLQEARQHGQAAHDKGPLDPKAATEALPAAPPIFFDDPRVSILSFKPRESLRITCLTIGSRGDVQPYIALCKGLIAEGHKPCIATHLEFKDWIISYGVDFRPVAGDPAELMRICVENGMFTVNFLREATSKFRGWLDGLLVSAWQACQGTDLLIESPSAMAGTHIAEALEIPYMRAFSMPWTRTRAYPHAFGVPENRMGGYYNYMTYVMFDRVFWKAIAGQINSWRKKDLGLGSTNYEMLQSNKVPFLYFYSPSVVPPPADYSEWIRITGYWFLDVEPDYSPPQDIVDFVAKARKDAKKIVYIGFGSIVVEDPAALTQTVVDSVLKADVRCILSKGWSDRLGRQKDASNPEVPLPPEILHIKGAPHDWLFRQIDAAVHHGGSGTTGASLRAGIPTIIKPFFGDQFFFGSRVEALGVGICLNKINVKVLAKALWEATHSQRLQVKARILGEQIRQEDGVSTAIQTIYRDLDYARTLSKRRNRSYDHGAADLEEETWTFIGDESDSDLQRTLEEATASKHLTEDLQHQRGVKGV